MIPVDVVLAAWRETKTERCVHPDPVMGRDLLPQVHLELADGTPMLVMMEERMALPALPAVLGLRQPVQSATFMADSWHRESTDRKEADAIRQGDLGRAFAAGDPRVHEALVLHSVGALDAETVIQPYVIGDDGLPEWGTVERFPASESDGAVPDLLRLMIEASQ